MPEHGGDVWKDESLANKFLTGIRGAIPMASEQIEVMMMLIKSLDSPVQSFLDLGCGDGILAAAILQEFPQANGVLLDFSDAMIAAARKNLLNYAQNHNFITYDYGNPNWVELVREASPFDAIVSGFSIHHQTDERKKDIYAEIYNLLSPGGIFINIEHTLSPTPWVATIADNALIDSIYNMHKRQGSDITRDRIAAEYVHRPDKVANILAPAADQCNWLREIGYTDVDCYFKILELAVFGGRRGKESEVRS